VSAIVGETTQPYVDVYPYDETTVAVLRVLRPDGTESTPDISEGVPTTITDEDGQQLTVLRFTADPVVLGLPRAWVLVWTTTGTGAATEAQQIWVDDLPAAGGLAWTPSLQRVASYVPRRTLVHADDGYGVIRRTFDDTTHPDAATVTMLINDAVSWVSDRTGALDITLHDSGKGLAARRAAAYVELGYPDNDTDTKIAEILLRTLEAELKALATRNEAITGQDPDDPSADEGVFLSTSMFTDTSSYGGWF
jgi:hypothetical protein